MKKLLLLPVPVILLGLAVLHSCAAPKPKGPSRPVPPPSKPPAAAPVERKPLSGMRGFVVLVDERGETVSYQSTASAVLSVKPARDGKTTEGKTTSVNPQEDGSFFVSLKEGVYSVEVFIKGFHVESFTVNVPKNEVIDVGAVTVQKFEAEGGKPAKVPAKNELPPNEGDVNIQPPVS